MAGLSSRFKVAGYKVPKYMLRAHGKSLFQYSVESFKKYYSTEKFLFIALNTFDTRKFIESECKALGIKSYQVVVLDEATKGQAETVYLGVKTAGIAIYEPLLIFNIDTFRPGFCWPKEFDINVVDGYLETFIGSGKNWSNVLPDDQLQQTVKLTAEKQEISKYCCTGLYYWRFCNDFCRIFEIYQKTDVSRLDAGEYYIAPMYNMLISEGKDVRYSVVGSENVTFCGIPSEYEEFKAKS